MFILSFRHRDSLAALAATGGWQVIAARRIDDAERRFLASGAGVAVVDARAALDEGLAAARTLGEVVTVNGGALLALVSATDVAALGEFYDAGATHFLVGPHDPAAFVQALRFAARHVERLAGGWRATEASDKRLGWRWQPGHGVEPSPVLARLAGVDGPLRPAAALRLIGRADRALLIAALRRFERTAEPIVVSHDLAELGRVVAHVRRDTATGAIDAMLEAPSQRNDDDAGDGRTAAGARRWLDRRLGEGGDRAPAVLLIALTRFDLVNATYGRAAGDALLRAAMKRIEDVASDLFGRGGIVARLSGSEFMLAAPATGGRIDLVAERLSVALARPFVAGDAVVVLGSRIGVAAPVAGDDAARLLRRASEALAEAKASDSATIRTAPGGDRDAVSIEKLAVDLRHAMDRDEIEVLFQPQVSIASGAIVGVEALARWEHGRLGSLGAETLFAAADRADLAIALSDRVQQLALARAARWPAMLTGLRLSVNLTAADIARPGFADLFLDRIDTSGFPRNRLTVEITESGLIDDLGAAAGLLTTLRSAGCRVAIDDFGTGYSSLAYLKALPLDYLKIDKKLAQDIAGTPRDRVVVRGVIEMARSLGLAVIAEGVETPEQLDLLAKEGCNYYQGFLCAEALTSEALAALVDRA
ncbi:bifunctional diguanylate cyclase/phosphodiesterase [Sphingomonas koreensis]|nr:bifunctional diguanylate cyclase/phosphodiesterase [Sphingomonas koreensis]